MPQTNAGRYLCGRRVQASGGLDLHRWWVNGTGTLLPTGGILMILAFWFGLLLGYLLGVSDRTRKRDLDEGEVLQEAMSILGKGKS